LGALFLLKQLVAAQAVCKQAPLVAAEAVHMLNPPRLQVLLLAVLRMCLLAQAAQLEPRQATAEIHGLTPHQTPHQLSLLKVF
jgi:hypothetical protein